MKATLAIPESGDMGQLVKGSLHGRCANCMPGVHDSIRPAINSSRNTLEVFGKIKAESFLGCALETACQMCPAMIRKYVLH